jgi:hypothetical protein
MPGFAHPPVGNVQSTMYTDVELSLEARVRNRHAGTSAAARA